MSVHGSATAEEHSKGSSEHHTSTITATTHAIGTHDTTGHLLIIGGTLLIIAVQIITSRKKK
jgi:hypothetical protein